MSELLNYKTTLTRSTASSEEKMEKEEDQNCATDTFAKVEGWCGAGTIVKEDMSRHNVPAKAQG